MGKLLNYRYHLQSTQNMDTEIVLSIKFILIKRNYRKDKGIRRKNREQVRKI